MKLNKYLKELGYEWKDLPGNYDETLGDDCSCAAADPRNQENEEGFCDREFWNLDYTLDLLIYPKLCYFREHYAKICTPGCFCDLENGHEQWLAILDKIIDGFKLSIDKPYQANFFSREDCEKISNARKLLAEYWDCLWF